MLYYLNFVLYFFSMLYIPILCDFCLKRRWKQIPRWMYIVGFCLVAGYPAFRKFTNAETNTTNQFYYIILISIIFLQIFLLYRDTLWKKVSVLIFVIMIPAIGEACAIFVCKQFPEYVYQIDYTTMETTILVALTLACTILLTAFLMIPWLRFTAKTILPLKKLSVYMFLLLGQLLLLNYCTSYSYYAGNKVLMLIVSIGVLISVAADYCELRFTLNQNEREQCQEELDALRYQWQVEKQQYDELERNTDEVARFRHDAKNRLAVIRELVSEGHSDKAIEACERMLETEKFI